jgi:predicted enzyme related to lactoylglutathione lyase
MGDGMTSRIAQWTLDVHDVRRMADFWSQVLNYEIEKSDGDSVHLYPPEGANPAALSVWLQPTTAPKRDKNRNHPDLRVHGEDLDTEVERVVALGAQHIDIGQTGDEPFVVLADPEGNEFCILHDKPQCT